MQICFYRMKIIFIEWKYIFIEWNNFYRILLHFGNHNARLSGYFLTRTFLCHFCIPSMPRCIFRSLHSCAKKKKHECLLRWLRVGKMAEETSLHWHNHTGISVEVRVGIISNLNVLLIYHSGLKQVRNTANQAFSRTSNLPHSHKALCHSPSCWWVSVKERWQIVINWTNLEKRNWGCTKFTSCDYRTNT